MPVQYTATLAVPPPPPRQFELFGGGALLEPEDQDCIARLVAEAESLFSGLETLDLPARVEAINRLRAALGQYSPFAAEPVDCVQWVHTDHVQANDYNPNAVAPPEMRLLERSIAADGYTQPIVAWEIEGGYEVVDGFHRNRVGREVPEIRERIKGYLPLAIINADRHDRGDRIAATIRHNRARGKHQVSAMSEIVLELKRRNWSNEKIGRELGMDPDEVLRLAQITGLAEMFADREFSEAWEAAAIQFDDSLDIADEDDEHEPSLAPAPAKVKPIVEGWDHRTANQSIYTHASGQVLGKVRRAPGNPLWRWTFYGPPIETGMVEDKAAAMAQVEAWL